LNHAFSAEGPTDCSQFCTVKTPVFSIDERLMNEFSIKINVSQIFCQLTYIRRIWV